MSTLAEDLRGFLQEIGRVIPADLGLRPNTISIVRRVWPSGRIDVDDSDDSDALTLSPDPRIREVNTQEIASSGGVYELGDLKVTRITPAYAGPPSGGYTVEQIAPTVEAGARGVEIVYVVAGPDAGEYRRVTASVDHALHYELVLRRRTQPTP